MFEALLKVVRSATKAAIFTHLNPDGDAMGSSYGMKLILNQLGVKAEVFLLDGCDKSSLPLVIKGESQKFSFDECDLFIALDAADSDRLGEYEEKFLSHPNTIAIDHHETHKKYAKASVIKSVSSTCELIADFAKELGVTLTKDIANNLYLGMVTDTGNFKYSCVSGDTLRTAAELKDVGVDSAEIAKRVFDTKTREYYALMRIALNKTEYFMGDKVAALYLSSDDYDEAGLDESEAGGIVNIPNSIDGVEVGVFIRNREKGEFKVSLRSNRYVNVAKVAESFGGGGHNRAAGYTAMCDTAEEALKQLLSRLASAL